LGKGKQVRPDARKVPPVQRQRLSPDARREHMLKPGLSLFGTRPYADVSVAEICAAAGVSTALLQHYFGTKSAYFVAVVQDAIAELERLTRPINGPRNFACLDQHMRAFFGFMCDHPMGAAVMRQDAQAHPDIAAMTDRYRDRTYELVVDALGVSIVSDKLSAAIRCWIGLNETIVMQLIANRSLEIDWAAKFSAECLQHFMKVAE
jgi:AcrR family transcriptional regulator